MMPSMIACLMLGTGLLLVGTSAAAVAARIRLGNDPNSDLAAELEAALQEIANSPPSAPRFAAQPGVAEQPDDCVDYAGMRRTQGARTHLSNV